MVPALVRTDSLGDSLWSRTYGGGSFDEANALLQTFDGGFILAGYSDSFGQGWGNAWLVKTDSIGNMEWNHTYGNVLEAQAFDIVQLPDSGFAATSWYIYDVGDARVWLFRTDRTGDSLWSRQWGVPHLHSEARALARTANGGFVLAGIKNWVSNTLTSGDAWLLRIEPERLGVVDRWISSPGSFQVTVCPNPFNSKTTIALDVPFGVNRIGLLTYNLLGQQVKRQQLPAMASTLRYNYDASDLATGIYLLRMTAGKQSAVQKIVVLR